jgi:hypothetical protein
MAWLEARATDPLFDADLQRIHEHRVERLQQEQLPGIFDYCGGLRPQLRSLSEEDPGTDDSGNES